MTTEQALAALEEAGTAQNRKVYGRHGVTGEMYGVSYAHLDKLAKKIGADQEVARGLWASGNHDARILATKIADPAAISSRELDAWARELDNYIVSDAFSVLVARHDAVEKKFASWTKRRNDFVSQAGWNLLAHLAMREDERDDAFFAGQLERIEEEIGSATNRARHAMNNAVIAIGLRTPALRKKALATAKRIGKIEVDHGDTSCTTPEAAEYIAKVVERRRAGKGKGKRKRC